MSFTFQVRTPELSLSHKLAEISKRILPSAAPMHAIRIDELVATIFRPHLESDWGSIYSALPNFFDQFVRGRWKGNDQQHLPTTLVGDFGELLTACVLRAMGATHVTRVIRASHLRRPDFIAYFPPPRSEAIAIEVKAGAVNASRLKEATRKAIRADHTYQFNICSLLRERRKDGIMQIWRTTGAPAGLLPPSNRPWNLGKARVPAHRTAIATPYFIDGRISQASTLWNHHSKPKACGSLRCVECVMNGAKGPLPVLLPIFYNSKIILEPLLPPDDLESYVRAHALAARAVWCGSQSLFRSAWKQLVSLLLLEPQQLESGRREAAGHLLDVLAAGVEAEIVRDVQEFLRETKLTNEILSDLMEKQLREAAQMRKNTGEQPEETKQTSQDAEEQLNEVGPPIMVVPLTQSESDPAERWERFWRGSPQTRSRARHTLTEIDPEQGAELRDWVENTSRDQKILEATLETSDATVFWLPSDKDEQAEFRIAAKEEETALKVAKKMLDVLGVRPDNQYQYFELKGPDGKTTHITKRDGAVLAGEAIIGAEGVAIVRITR